MNVEVQMLALHVIYLFVNSNDHHARAAARAGCADEVVKMMRNHETVVELQGYAAFCLSNMAGCDEETADRLSNQQVLDLVL